MKPAIRPRRRGRPLARSGPRGSRRECPAAITWPRWSTKIREQRRITRSMSCSTSSMARSWARRSSSTVARRRVSMSSSPDAGSSSSSTFGSVASARPSSTSRARPVGGRRPVGRRRRRARAPRRSRRPWRRPASSTALRARSTISAAVRTLSYAVIEPNTSSRWNVRFMPRRARRCGGADEMSTPSRCTAPGAPLHAGDGVEGGGLPGAVRADQPDDLTSVDREGDVMDGEMLAEPHAQVVHLEHGHCRCLESSFRSSGGR